MDDSDPTPFFEARLDISRINSLGIFARDTASDNFLESSNTLIILDSLDPHLGQLGALPFLIPNERPQEHFIRCQLSPMKPKNIVGT